MNLLSALRRRVRGFREGHTPVIYHRVSRLDVDPSKLAVPPEVFAEQMEALARHRQVVPLDALAGELARGRAPRRLG